MKVKELKRFVDAMVAGGLGHTEVKINEGRDGHSDFVDLDATFGKWEDTEEVFLIMRRV